MAADGQRYANPDASICEARASACVSIYSRIFVTLPSLSENGSAHDKQYYRDLGKRRRYLPKALAWRD
jgi:hypothetical protein